MRRPDGVTAECRKQETLLSSRIKASSRSVSRAKKSAHIESVRAKRVTKRAKHTITDIYDHHTGRRILFGARYQY